MINIQERICDISTIILAKWKYLYLNNIRAYRANDQIAGRNVL